MQGRSTPVHEPAPSVSINQPMGLSFFAASGRGGQLGFTIEDNEGRPGENQDMVLRDVWVLQSVLQDMRVLRDRDGMLD